MIQTDCTRHFRRKFKMIAFVTLLPLLLWSCESRDENQQDQGSEGWSTAESITEPSTSPTSDEGNPSHPSHLSDPVEDNDADFLSFRWGMSKDDVVSQLATTNYRESNVEISVSDIEFLGFNSRRVFIFEPDTGKLEMIAHSLDTTEMESDVAWGIAAGQVGVEYFTKVQRELDRMYSTFTDENVGVGLYEEREPAYFDGWEENVIGSALGNNLLIRQMVASDSNVVLRHWLQIGENHVSHSVVAFDPETAAEKYEQFRRSWKAAAN